MKDPANIADLVRLEDEIDEALLNLLNKPGDERTIDDLKRCRMHLRDEIEHLLHEAHGGSRPACTNGAAPAIGGVPNGNVVSS